MLIAIEANFKLPIIRLLLVLRRGEQFHDVILGEQGAAQNSHDLHDWTAKFEVVLNNPDETVCDDSNMNLNAHRIVDLYPEGFDSEVLLDPFEEQLHLPPIFIQESDVLGRKIEVIRIVCERTAQFRSIIDDTSDFAWILFLVLLLRKENGLVSQDIVSSIKNVFAVKDFIIRSLLLTHDKERSRHCNLVKLGEIKVASVKYIARQRLVGEPVHGVDIVHLGIGNSVEHRNLRNDVNLSVDSDVRLCASALGFAALLCNELCLSEYGHTEVNIRRVNGVEPSMQLKLTGNPSLLSKEHHVEGKLFKDTVVPGVVRFEKRALVDGRLSESEMKRLLSMGGCYICEVSQSTAAHEQPKHEYEKMAPVRRSPVFGSVARLGNKAFEIPLWKKAGYLSDNVQSDMHICPKFDVDAKVRISKVRQDFLNLLCCA